MTTTIEPNHWKGQAARNGQRQAFRSHKIPLANQKSLSLWVTCALSFSMLKNLCKDTIFVMKADGSRLGPMKAMVQPGEIITFQNIIPIDDGDKIIRVLAQDREESYTVLQAHWQEGAVSIPGFYQLEVRKDTALPRSTSATPPITNNFHGHNARVNIHSTDNSMNTIGTASVFEDIRAALRVSDNVEDANLREELLALVAGMEKEPKTSAFAKKYSDFVALAANHMAVLSPFLPALTKFLPGT